MSPDVYRREAERAAHGAINDWASNSLIRAHVWQIVARTLDAYDQAIAEDTRLKRPAPSWVVLHENGLPWLVVPTHKMARQQRRVLADLSGTPRWRLRIVRVEVARP